MQFFKNQRILFIIQRLTNMDHSVPLIEKTAKLVLPYAIHKQKGSKMCSITMNRRKNEKRRMPSLRYFN